MRALLTLVMPNNLAVFLYVTRMDRNMLLFVSLVKPILIFLKKSNFSPLINRSDMTKYSKSDCEQTTVNHISSYIQCHTV